MSLRTVFRSKARKATAGVAGALVVAGLTVGAALAFYGGSGTGSASASAGTAPRTVTVSGVANPNTPLYPGESRPIDITVTLVGPGSARVGSITSTGITTGVAGCLPSWFSFTSPTIGGTGTNVSAGSPLVLSGATSGASLTFTDAPVNQDACSDANLSIALAASPS